MGEPRAEKFDQFNLLILLAATQLAFYNLREHDLTDMADIEIRRFELVPGPFCLAEMVNNAVLNVGKAWKRWALQVIFPTWRCLELI